MTRFAEMTKQSVIRYIVTALLRIYGSTTQRFNELMWRSNSSFRVSTGFTLIELIVVITVIVVLTGMFIFLT